MTVTSIPLFQRRSDDRQAQRFAAFALIALAALNTADVLLTRAVIHRVGLRAEANVFARAMLSGYHAELIKLLVCGALILKTITRPRITLGWLVALYAAVGVYAMTVVVNLLAWRAVG